MNKNFDSWNRKKKEINEREDFPAFYHEREIWWCTVGTNIGVEADGKSEDFDRPVVILRGFNKKSFLGIALTGKNQSGKYYMYLGKVDGRDASANLSQIRLFDTKRLTNKIGMLDQKTFEMLRKTVRDLL